MTSVDAFLHRLHQRVGPRCFASGAFVLQVPVDPAFDRLLDDLSRGSSRRVGTTHADFRSAAALTRRRLCGSACAAPIAGVRAGPQREYRLSTPLRPCDGPQSKRVLLWYQFWVGGARYLYLKLEAHPALSVRHALAAASRYVLKRQSQLPTRRENAYKDRGGLVTAAAMALAAEDAQTLWPQAADEAARYDASVRIGREMFVPAAVAAELVHYSDDLSAAAKLKA